MSESEQHRRPRLTGGFLLATLVVYLRYCACPAAPLTFRCSLFCGLGFTEQSIRISDSFDSLDEGWLRDSEVLTSMRVETSLWTSRGRR